MGGIGGEFGEMLGKALKLLIFIAKPTVFSKIIKFHYPFSLKVTNLHLEIITFHRNSIIRPKKGFHYGASKIKIRLI